MAAAGRSPRAARTTTSRAARPLEVRAERQPVGLNRAVRVDLEEHVRHAELEAQPGESLVRKSPKQALCW